MFTDGGGLPAGGNFTYVVRVGLANLSQAMNYSAACHRVLYRGIPGYGGAVIERTSVSIPSMNNGWGVSGFASTSLVGTSRGAPGSMVVDCSSSLSVMIQDVHAIVNQVQSSDLLATGILWAGARRVRRMWVRTRQVPLTGGRAR